MLGLANLVANLLLWAEEWRHLLQFARCSVRTRNQPDCTDAIILSPAVNVRLDRIR
jgi:hypothetical protein